MTYGTLRLTAYSPVARLLHWLVAAGVLVLVPTGIVMMRLNPGALQIGLYEFHKSLGFLVMVLMVIRLGYRIVFNAPVPEPSLAAWRRAVSSITHGLLYLLLIVQPLIGWAAMSAFGDRMQFFGLFTLPKLVATNRVFAEQLMATHRAIGLLLAVLVLVHIAAALQHYIVRKDGVLQRMLPAMMGGR